MILPNIPQETARKGKNGPKNFPHNHIAINIDQPRLHLEVQGDTGTHSKKALNLKPAPTGQEKLSTTFRGWAISRPFPLASRSGPASAPSIKSPGLATPHPHDDIADRQLVHLPDHICFAITRDIAHAGNCPIRQRPLALLRQTGSTLTSPFRSDPLRAFRACAKTRLSITARSATYPQTSRLFSG